MADQVEGSTPFPIGQTIKAWPPWLLHPFPKSKRKCR